MGLNRSQLFQESPTAFMPVVQGKQQTHKNGKKCAWSTSVKKVCLKQQMKYP